MIKRIEPKVYDYILKLNEENGDVLIPTNRGELEYLAEKMGFHVVGEQLIRGGTVKISQQVLLLQHQVGQT